MIQKMAVITIAAFSLCSLVSAETDTIEPKGGYAAITSQRLEQESAGAKK